MVKRQTRHRRLRCKFGKINEIEKIPNLLEIQKKSFDAFIGSKTSDEGLRGAFDVFPIISPDGSAELEFLDYELGEPRFDAEECRLRGLTFGRPLKVKFRLNAYDVDSETGARPFKHSKEQDVHLGDVPVMTDSGTFVVNGAERVVVSQLHRSPGVFFDHDKGRKSTSRKLRYSARIIPYRGSWLEFEFDIRDRVFFRVDREVKLPVTVLLYAFDKDREEICRALYGIRLFTRKGEGTWFTPVVLDSLHGTTPNRDLVDADTGEVVAKKNKRISTRVLRDITATGIRNQLVTTGELVGLPSAQEIVDPKTGVVLVDAGAPLTPEALAGVGDADLEVLDVPEGGGFVHRMILGEIEDETRNREVRGDSVDSARTAIYCEARSSHPPSAQAAEDFFLGKFCRPAFYDLSRVGRAKMNRRLGFKVPETMRTLRAEDVLAVVRELENLRHGQRPVDDIDHLGNRRVRSVGELFLQQYRTGLVRMERSIRERIKRINPADLETMKPEDLINARTVVSVVREFISGSELSQFMDQTNPLSEMAHKRRISALGPRGLNRRNASFEVRDVHRTHYGRICPIETPEGGNIGLVNSFATFARVDRLGFIETPFRKVKKGLVTDEVVYLSATEEIDHRIAQANEPIGRNNRLKNDEVLIRQDNGESETFRYTQRDEVDLIDVSPKQVVSVSAALIPFLENDDANRALMGSNMQRQAVPLIEPEAPLVGTGMEEKVAGDSGSAFAARRGGVIDQVDASRIVIRVTDRIDPGDLGVDIYRLRKFQRSNQNTSINQRPLVKVGERVAKGDVIADGPSTDLGELALGRNVLVAFMPWEGYNFEDSILVSERIVREDVFTSINIEEHVIVVRDTKLGPEEVTRDLPNVGEDGLRNLDEAGMVYIGAEVRAGDILVGKITPKGETPMTPEEKLLRAIFGEKAATVRDTSLRLPPGDAGTVVEVRVFTRHGVDKDERARQIEEEEIERLGRDRADEEAILERNISARLRGLLAGQTLTKEVAGRPVGSVLDAKDLSDLDCAALFRVAVSEASAMDQLEQLHAKHKADYERISTRFEDKCVKVRSGDELQAGLIKTVKVFVAVKRKLQAGDKMSGRHGNKGVISRVLPIEDMPYLADGTSVDVVLNPLGVPSRMNVGQILETHLGWAARGLGRTIGELLDANRSTELRRLMDRLYGKETLTPLGAAAFHELCERARSGVHFATPVFDGTRAEEIATLLETAGLDRSGQETLYDGRTGEAFARKVTVGYKYLMKLHHLVDDKIHARSTGPYSLVTQQPVRGKARFGGQRVGEMEVWALQAYGAAHTLREMLTYKSDDVIGRAKAYEAIVKGETVLEANCPESFKVLIHELKALGMNVETLSDETATDEISGVPTAPISARLPQ